MLNPEFRSEREIKKLWTKRTKLFWLYILPQILTELFFPEAESKTLREKNRLKSNNCYKLSKKIYCLSNVLIILVNISIIKCFLLKEISFLHSFPNLDGILQAGMGAGACRDSCVCEQSTSCLYKWLDMAAKNNCSLLLSHSLLAPASQKSLHLRGISTCLA